MRDITARRKPETAPRVSKPPPGRGRRSFLGIRDWGAVRRRGSRALLWSAFAGLMAGIVVNATALQKGHHPAPLIMLPEPSRASRAEPAAAPRIAAARPEVPPSPAPAEPESVSDEPAPPSPLQAHVDGIGQVLKGTSTLPKTAAAPHPRPADARAASKVAAAPRPEPADRNRLAAMMGAASKGHAPVPN